MTYGFSEASRAESSSMFSSGWNMGCHRTLCISGHLKGRPKPGTVHPICLRFAIVSEPSTGAGLQLQIVEDLGGDYNVIAPSEGNRELC